MPFTGEVNVTIYFGTKFDDFNVPFRLELLRNSATKTIEKTGQAVWQNTWLAEITVNVADYQDIVGAQYVEIFDVGTTNHGSHIYDVLGYYQVSQKSVTLGILYNPLISIGINHITEISGILRRWTVNDDTHFNYINSPEPINQIDDFDYSYFRYQTVVQDVTIPIAGFPYIMSSPPKVAEYLDSGILYPELEGTPTSTTFKSSIGGDLSFNDGMLYHLWKPQSGNLVFDSYRAAIGLGFSLIVQAYQLPVYSHHISMEVAGAADDITSITGKTAVIDSGLSLYSTSFRNAKAGEIGTFFSLYNEATGDCVTLENKDLSNTQIEVSCNPYYNGNFMARFKGYFKDINGYSGYVKSVRFQPLSLNAFIGSGASANAINNIMSVDAVKVGAYNQTTAANIMAKNTQRTLTAGVESSAANVMVGAAMNNPLTTYHALTGFSNNLRASQAQALNASDTWINTLNAIDLTRQQQLDALKVQGTLGQVIPADFKLANDYNSNGAGYDFVVKKCSLSNRDRERADRFFTAYGYNVDGLQLNNPTQLKVRSRFTFVMADDVTISGVSGGTNLTRLRDKQTIDAIRHRFKSGLRIWQVEPDYNWTTANTII